MSQEPTSSAGGDSGIKNGIHREVEPSAVLSAFHLGGGPDRRVDVYVGFK